MREAGPRGFYRLQDPVAKLFLLDRALPSRIDLFHILSDQSKLPSAVWINFLFVTKDDWFETVLCLLDPSA